MSDYITWNEGEQTNFLRAVKDKTGLTWNEIAEHLNFSRGMLFFYLDESCRMSYETFLKLCKLGNLEPFKFYPHIIKKTKLSKITTLKSYTFPQKTNPQLAEFIGIYLGDGYLGPVSYEVSVSCGEIDYPYITNFIPNLMKRLFSIKPKIIYYKNSKGIKCYIFSKGVVMSFVNKYGFNSGRKIKPKIPNFIFEDDFMLKFCIRGLIDTDGGIYRHHKNSIQLAFYNSEYSLISSLKEAFLKLGYNPKFCKYGTRDGYVLFLFTKEVEKYFKEIGSNNNKNILKFKLWKETGRVPKNNEILDEILNK